MPIVTLGTVLFAIVVVAVICMLTLETIKTVNSAKALKEVKEDTTNEAKEEVAVSEEPEETKEEAVVTEEKEPQAEETEEEKVEEPEEETEEETVVSFEETEETEEEEEETTTIVEETEEGKTVTKLQLSFQAKLSRANEEVVARYNEIKNELDAYGVKNVLSWDKERFAYKRNSVAKLKLRGKNLYVYLAVDPAEYVGSTKYNLKDVSAVKANAGTPALLKVKSDRAVRRAKELIAVIANKYQLEKKEVEKTDYSVAQMTDEELLENKLAKWVTYKVRVFTKEEK